MVADEQVERAYNAFVIGMQRTGTTKEAIRLALEAAEPAAANLDQAIESVWAILNQRWSRHPGQSPPREWAESCVNAVLSNLNKENRDE